MKKLLLFVLILSIFQTSMGCRRIKMARTLKKYELILEPLVGVATKKDIIERYGNPNSQTSAEGIEYWEYHISHGFKSSGSANVGMFGTVNSRSNTWEQFDSIKFTFNSKGILETYQTGVQR